MNNFDIKNKTIFLTGAGGLFGKRLTEVFLNEEANLVLCVHNKNKIDKINHELQKKYSKEKYLILEFENTNTESIIDCVKKSIEKYETIDVLINNAAIDASFSAEKKDRINTNSFENYPIELVKKSIDVNMTGTINTTQIICKQMLKQGYGNIINVGSIYSILAPNKNLYDFGPDSLYKPVDYVVSKSFVPNFTRFIAANYSNKNIRCNAITPHGIFNDQDEKFLNNFSKLSPAGRMCKIEELDGPFLFLASDASSYMNGETIVLDGGWSVW